MSSSGQHLYGLSVPTGNYVNSITENFPSVKRKYKVDASISNRYVRDYLSTNVNANNGSVSDKYLEFILDSSEEEFFDLNSFYIELKLKITKADGSNLDANSNVTIVDGIGNRILSRSSLYLNSTPIENNSYYGLTNAFKSYLNMSKDHLKSVGRNMYFKSLKTKIFDKIDADTFQGEKCTREEKEIIEDVKKEIHFICPLSLDIASSGFYLLNGVSIRLRYDLAHPSVIINSHDQEQYTYNLTHARLHAQKIVPAGGALLSLQKHLTLNNTSIEYLYEKPVVKNFIFPSGHSNLTLDNIFNGSIVNQMYVFFISQSAVNGDYARNAAYFSHCNLSNVILDINGNTVTKLVGEFPRHIAHLFHHTISNVPSSKNLLTLNNYRSGRTILAWDLCASEASDVIQFDKTGNIRLSLQCKIPLTENMVVFVIGTTSGLFEIDANRRVITNNKL